VFFWRASNGAEATSAASVTSAVQEAALAVFAAKLKKLVATKQAKLMLGFLVMMLGIDFKGVISGRPIKMY